MSSLLQELSIVLPVFNEAPSIESVLRELHAKVASKLADVEFVVAEDGSTDGTPEILARVAPELGIRLVSSRERKGYSRAVKDALALASKPWIFFSDSDGQHEPEDVFRMAELAERTGADIVAGVKTPRRDPWPRLALSRGLRAANRVILGAKFKDVNCGFRLMRRSVIEEMLPHANKLSLFVNTELQLRAWAAGYRVEELPVRHYERAEGGSRGLPANRVPAEVAKLLSGLLALRAELTAARRVHQPEPQ